MKRMLCALLVTITAGSASGQEPPRQGGFDPAEMAKMMEKVKAITSPGKNHDALERFIGKWNTETRIFSGGQPVAPAEKGSARVDWLIKGRWIKSEQSGTMMGIPIEGFMILGYDNFKQSYVMTSVSSMDTAMLHGEGDMDPGDKALLVYGTLDEYLTGEHDKMVKYVWRFESADKIVFEIHDLPIGENHTKVVEMVFHRE